MSLLFKEAAELAAVGSGVASNTTLLENVQRYSSNTLCLGIVRHVLVTVPRTPA